MTWMCISNAFCQGALETRKWKNWLLWDFCKRGDEGQTEQHTNYIATKKYIDFILRAEELECEEKGLYDKVVQNTVGHKY